MYLVSSKLILYIAFIFKYLLSNNGWFLYFDLRLKSWVHWMHISSSCIVYIDRIMCIVLQQGSHFFHHSRSTTTKCVFWWGSTSSRQWTSFILHKTLTNPRRIFSAWKNLRHRVLMKVLNALLKCYIRSSYECIIWKLQTHRYKSWSNSTSVEVGIGHARSGFKRPEPSLRWIF